MSGTTVNFIMHSFFNEFNFVQVTALIAKLYWLNIGFLIKRRHGILPNIWSAYIFPTSTRNISPT